MRPAIPLAVCLFIITACGCSSTPTSPSNADPTRIVALELHYPGPLGADPGFMHPGGRVSFRAYAIDAQGHYTNVTNSVRWASSDPNAVVALETSSTVQALGLGTAWISGEYQGFRDSLFTRVIDPLQPIVYPSLTIVFTAGTRLGAAPFVKAFYQESQTDSALEVTNIGVWTWSKPNVIRFENGRIVAVGPGTGALTVSHRGLSASYYFSVPPPGQF